MWDISQALKIALTETAKESAAKPNPNWMRKRKREGSAGGPEPEKHTASGPRDPPLLKHQATLLPFAVARPLDRGGSGDAGSQTSPESSWSEYLMTTEGGGREGGAEREVEWEQRTDREGEKLLDIYWVNRELKTEVGGQTNPKTKSQ